MSAHYCHATGCLERIVSHKIFCAEHWEMVPANLKPLLENEMKEYPSKTFCQIFIAAVEAVEQQIEEAA